MTYNDSMQGALSLVVITVFPWGASLDLCQVFFFFQRFLIYFWDRERQSMNGGGAEREGDTELETGSRL